jgi:hypothetical protein
MVESGRPGAGGAAGCSNRNQNNKTTAGSNLMKISTAFLVCSLIGITPALVLGTPTTIAQWTFETSQPTTAGPYTAELGVSPGSASGSHAGTATYSSPVGNGSSHSFSATAWAVGDYWQFSVSTLGFQGMSLSWDQASSATGPRDFGLFWSVTGLANSFTQVGAIYAVLLNPSPSTWNSSTTHSEYSLSYDLSGITALDNVSTVYFQLMDMSTTNVNGGNVRSTGTDRIDNFTVNGTEMSTNVPDSLPGLAGLSCVLGMLVALRRMTRAGSFLPATKA